MNSQYATRRVVVTGYGAICSLGKNSKEIWDAIVGYRVGYAKETHPNASVVTKFFGNMPVAPDVSNFSKTLLKNLPKFAKIGLVAADEAVKMAFSGNSSLDEFYAPFERGVIFGTGWGGQDATVENNDTYNRDGIASPLTNILSMHSVGTAAISINWGLRGYQNTPIGATEASFNDALPRARIHDFTGGVAARHWQSDRRSRTQPLK